MSVPITVQFAQLKSLPTLANHSKKQALVENVEPRNETNKRTPSVEYKALERNCPRREKLTIAGTLGGFLKSHNRSAIHEAVAGTTKAAGDEISIRSRWRAQRA